MVRTPEWDFWNLATRLGISSIPLLIPLMIQIAYGQSAVVSGWIVLQWQSLPCLENLPLLKSLNRFGYRKTLMFTTFLVH